jgi:hypothetical protein
MRLDETRQRSFVQASRHALSEGTVEGLGGLLRIIVELEPGEGEGGEVTPRCVWTI